MFCVVFQLDKDYLLNMITSSDASAPFTELRTYITDHEGQTTSNEKSIDRVNKCELSALLLLNVSVCCLKAKELYPATSEAAIDALCVSGLYPKVQEPS